MKIVGSSMYICICNALREKELAAAASGDVKTVGEVFRRCGRRPQCGKCLPDVAQMIEAARADKDAQICAAE